MEEVEMSEEVAAKTVLKQRKSAKDLKGTLGKHKDKHAGKSKEELEREARAAKDAKRFRDEYEGQFNVKDFLSTNFTSFYNMLRFSYAHVNMIDQFGYAPRYKYRPFRSKVGALWSVFCLFFFFTFVGVSIERMAVNQSLVSNKQLAVNIPEDVTSFNMADVDTLVEDTWPLSEIGFEFYPTRSNELVRTTAPLVDPRMFSFVMEQVTVGRDGMRVEPLPTRECTVSNPQAERDENLIEVGTCKASGGEMVGSPADLQTFGKYVRVTMLRCNGTVEGQFFNPVVQPAHNCTANATNCVIPDPIILPEEPLPCLERDVIDAAVARGTVRMVVREDRDDEEFRYYQREYEMAAGLQIKSDFLFEAVKLVKEPRYLIDWKSENILLLDSEDRHYAKLSRGETPPHIVGFNTTTMQDIVQYGNPVLEQYLQQITGVPTMQSPAERGEYAVWTFRLSGRKTERNIDKPTVFGLFVSWGGMFVFFNVVVGYLVRKYNEHRFHNQMEEKDLREYDAGDFTATGALVYQHLPLPDELEKMDAEVPIDEQIADGRYF